MPTPHIAATPGDFADTVLLPGDPLRAKHVAETFLDDVREVNKVRNMLGYTGHFQGREISVMGSGMGIPSLSIYAFELVREYGVRRLIRIGSCGAVRDDIRVGDVIVGAGACTDSSVNRQRFLGYDFAAIADFELLRCTVDAAARLQQPIQVGNLFTSDLFYHPNAQLAELLKRFNIVGVEMEAAGLYGLACDLGVRALAICTVSNHIVSGEALAGDASPDGFNAMVNIALHGILRDDERSGQVNP